MGLGGAFRNQALPWSLELIERFEDRCGLGWECYSTKVYWKHALPWSFELIERYKDRWAGSVSQKRGPALVP